MPPGLLEGVHTALTAGVGIVALMIRAKVADLRVKTLEDERALREWVEAHFVSKETCDQHRRGFN